MGIAFAAAMVGIYILLIMETNSFLMPLLIMMAIPLNPDRRHAPAFTC